MASKRFDIPFTLYESQDFHSFETALLKILDEHFLDSKDTWQRKEQPQEMTDGGWKVRVQGRYGSDEKGFDFILDIQRGDRAMPERSHYKRWAYGLPEGLKYELNAYFEGQEGLQNKPLVQFYIDVGASEDVLNALSAVLT